MFEKLKKKKWLILIGILAFIGIAVFFKKSNHAVLVDTYTVSSKEVVKAVTASGKTTPKKEYVARSGAATKINKIFFESGIKVTEGEVILKLDEAGLKASADTNWKSYLDAKAAQNSLDSQIAAAKTDVNEKKFARDSAWRTYMSDSGEDAKQAYKTAESNYQDSVSALALLEDKQTAVSQGVVSTYSTYAASFDTLKSGVVKSPATGLLVLEDIAEGQSVTVGQKLFSITNFAGTEFTAEVDETDIQYIQIGQSVNITLEGYSDPFKGEITRIDGKTTVTSGGSTVVPTAVKFITGPMVNPILSMSGTATIEVGKEANSPAIPYDAVLYDSDDKTFVFVINGNEVEKREIQLGFEGTDYVVVKSGVGEGEKIVVGDAVSKLANGTKVSVTKN